MSLLLRILTLPYHYRHPDTTVRNPWSAERFLSWKTRFLENPDKPLEHKRSDPQKTQLTKITGFLEGDN